MLSLIGRDEILRNVYRVARLFDPEGDLTTFESLRRGYLGLLAQKNPHMPVNHSWDPFVGDPSVEEQLAKAFDVDVALNDMNQATVVGESFVDSERKSRIAFAREALQSLLALDDDLNLVFGLVVHSIFCKASNHGEGIQAAHGGSSSGSIGSTWLSIRESVTKNDLKEMFIHEMTHILLFVDELNFEQFDYAEIAKPENFARSAILFKNRPLDKSIHSIVVATELLLARRRWLGEPEDLTVHPRSASLAASTLEAAKSVFALENITKITSDRLLGFVEKCREHCLTFIPVEAVAQ